MAAFPILTKQPRHDRSRKDPVTVMERRMIKVHCGTPSPAGLKKKKRMNTDILEKIYAVLPLAQVLKVIRDLGYLCSTISSSYMLDNNFLL